MDEPAVEAELLLRTDHLVAFLELAAIRHLPSRVQIRVRELVNDGRGKTPSSFLADIDEAGSEEVDERGAIDRLDEHREVSL